MAAFWGLWLLVASALFAGGYLAGDLLRTHYPDEKQAAPPTATPAPTRPPAQAPALAEDDRPPGAPAPAVSASAEWPATAASPAGATDLQWLALALAALAAAVAGAVLREVWRRRAVMVVRDSPAFANALETWIPALLMRRNSPRALKRFLNRVRYFAMRQMEAPASERIPEPLLVALGALHQIDARLLQADDIAQATQAAILTDVAGLSSKVLEAGNSTGWPEPSHVDAFTLWSQGIHVR